MNHLPLPNWLIYMILAVAFLGFIDASYLTISHYTGSELNCTLTQGCGEVTSSEYSKIFGTPVALLGLLYYLTVLIGTLLYYDTRNFKIIQLLRPLSLAGFLFSAWFVYVQIFLIQAICQYCMLSAITSTILFILGLVTLKYNKS